MAHFPLGQLQREHHPEKKDLARHFSTHSLTSVKKKTIIWSVTAQDNTLYVYDYKMKKI